MDKIQFYALIVDSFGIVKANLFYILKGFWCLNTEGVCDFYLYFVFIYFKSLYEMLICDD